MKAIVQQGYGSPGDVLSLRDIEVPAIGDDEVLVRVRAASMHVDIWHVVTGRPYVVRLINRRRTQSVPGTDLAGLVETIGKTVTRFKEGDEVFGESALNPWTNGGAFAEYAAVRQDALAHKPGNVTFEQA